MTTKTTSGKKGNQFQPTPAMQDLIDTLERAVANKEYHAVAQTSYYTEAQGKAGKSPLQSCGTACCVSGDIALRHAIDQGFIDLDSSYVNTDDLWGFFGHHQVSSPWRYVQSICNLSDFEANLIFSSYTHYTIHTYMAKLFREGYKIEGDWRCIFQGSYLQFKGARIKVKEGDGVISCTDYSTPRELMRYLDTLKVKIQEAEG